MKTRFKKWYKDFNARHKSGFTLIELTVVISIIAVLVLVAVPNFLGKTQTAHTTKHLANAREIEAASERFYADEGDWPRLSNIPYTSEEVAKYSEKIYNISGEEVELDPNGNYYDIDYDKLDKYVKVNNSDKNNYILQNPVGKVFYLEQPDEEWPGRVQYTNVGNKKNTDSFNSQHNIPEEYVLVGQRKERVRETPKFTDRNNDGIPDDYVQVGLQEREEKKEPWFIDLNRDGIPDNYKKVGDESFEFVQDSSAPNTYNGVRGYYKYTGKENKIIIPEKIKGNIVRDYYRMFYQYKSDEGLEVASTSDAVTNTNYMFRYTDVPSIDVSYLNTSSVTTMMYMFGNGTATDITVGSMDTSNVTNMSGMFRTSMARNLDLSKMNTDKVTNMSFMFREASTSKLDIRNLNMSRVSNSSSMFDGAMMTDVFVKSLTYANKFQYMDSIPTRMKFKFYNNDDFEFVRDPSAPNTYDGIRGYYKYIGNEDKVILPQKLDGNTLKDNYRMFYNYENKNPLSVASVNDDVTNMDYMFNYTNVPSLNVRYLNTSNVTTMNYMFGYAKPTVLTVGEMDTSNVINMSGMFRSSLAKTLDLGDFDTSNVTNMSFMFRGSKTKTLDISSFDMTKVTNTSYMFDGSSATDVYTPSLTNANKFQHLDFVPNSMTFYGTPTDDFVFVRDNSAPNEYNGIRGYYKYVGSNASIIIPEKIDGNTLKDYYRMFHNYSNNKPLRVASVSDLVTNTDYMFNYTDVPSIDVSYLNTSSVTTMIYMFGYAKAKNITVGNIDTGNVVNMSGMFRTSLSETLNLSGFNTEKVTNMSFMFRGANTKIADISNFNMRSVKNTSYMFDGSNMREVYTRTLTEANKFQLMSDIPSGLTFRSTADDDFIFVRDNSAPHTYDGIKGYYKYIGIKNEIIIPTKIEGNTLKDYYKMFHQYENDKGVVVTSSSDAVTNTDYMFQYANVPAINVSGLNTSNVYSMLYMFGYATATDVQLVKMNTSNVTNMSGMFRTSLSKTLDLSNFDTKKVTNMSFMFRDARTNTVDISGFNISRVNNTTNMFSGFNGQLIQ